MGKTSATWRNKRETLWRHSAGLCHYCGHSTPFDQRTSDHVVPRAFGGPDALWNLVACCEPCNGDLGDAVRKCDCAGCARTIQRFHRMKRDPGRTGPVVWERKHHSDDWLVEGILKRIRAGQRYLDRIPDHDSHEAAALRGKLYGLREALALCAVNKVIDDVTLAESA